MNSGENIEPAPALIAEQILREIYGDDYQGCTINPDQIAAIIERGFQRQQQESSELASLYEKVVEAIDLLSTPPDAAKLTDPAELSRLLSERLDAIHVVTEKTRKTAARFKARLRGEVEDS
jgi:hypothetical protein